MFAKFAHLLHSFEARNCSTPKGGVLTATQELWMENATFRNCSSPQAAAPRMVTHRVVVTGLSEAALVGADRYVEALECDNGFEGYVDEYGTSCRRCANGYFQLQGGPKIVNGTIDGNLCVKVPQQTREASADKVRLRRGYMVEDSNISLSLHCPNEMACPGGRITTSGFSKMCETGYQGPGCVNCAQTHGRGSGDPFTCSRCATSTFRKAAEWTIYIFEQTVVFAISASGVIFAGEQSYESTIYSNQLMSYVMVSLPVLRQLQNSKSFKTMAFYVQEIIEAFSIPVDVANGIGSEGQSAECLLDYVGISKTLYGGDAIFLMLALSLMFLLSVMVDLWSAIVVAGNCYLPRLCFALGRHLACYRLHSEAHGQKLHCGFEKDVGMPMPVAIVLLGITFVGGAGSWLWLIRGEEHTSSPGVAYLTQPYKKECQSWEVTVLVRKVLLAVVCAVYPSSFNAVMQLQLIGTIVLVSLVMTMQNSPYVSEEHNRTEARLLILAMLMVLFTFCFHANEHSWTRTEGTQRSTLVFIVLLATGPAVVMSVRIVVALVREFMELYQEKNASQKTESDETDVT